MKGARWSRLLAVMLALGLFAAACGTDEPAEVAEDEPTDVGTETGEEMATETEAPTEATASPTQAEGGSGDGTLRLGYLLPETGQLAFLGPPMIAGVELAVSEINEAGGVLGSDVDLTGGDEAGDASVANTTVDRLLGQDVDAIIGAAASGMSLAVIDKVTGAGVVQCSPSNTSPSFTEYDDDGFYFRTAPTDALQGPVLAETTVGDGHGRIVIMARADDYGQGLADETEAALIEAGADVAEKIIYDPEAASFDSEVEQAVGADPDAIIIIGFDESAQILQGLIERGFGPNDFPVYGAESLRAADLPEAVDPSNPNVLDGLKGTAPVSRADESFIERLETANPNLADTLFGGESYDCVVTLALAAVAADSDDPAVFVDEINDVTRDGTECATFEECAALLADGEDIDYNGVSGPLDFIDAGEPARGVYEIWEFQDGEIVTLDEVESAF